MSPHKQACPTHSRIAHCSDLVLQVQLNASLASLKSGSAKVRRAPFAINTDHIRAKIRKHHSTVWGDGLGLTNDD